MTVVEWLDRYAGRLLASLIVCVFLGFASGLWILVAAAGFLLAVIIGAVLVSTFAAPLLPSRIPVRDHPSRDEHERAR